jgi:hypothetical protein
VSGEDEAFRRIVDILNSLDVRFFVAGSLASSIHGVYRATADIDLVVEFGPHLIERFVTELGPDFYADAEMIESSLAHERSFNVIHIRSGYKFDFFPRLEDRFHWNQFERRTSENAGTASEPLLIPIATAEDTILSKLAWYRAGGEVSDRQWNDVRGIIAVQGDRLDREYLHRWASHLKVDDLLERVLAA